MRSGIPLVATKLMPPGLTRSAICRPRLIESLHSVLVRRLVLVSAPAGYGKTTLLRQFVDKQRAAVWYSPDHRDRNPSVFLVHLMAAFARHVDGFCSRERRSLADGQELSIDALLSAITNELAVKTGPNILLLLDGYHEVECQRGINYAVDYLLRNLPSNVHIVISCRGVPRLEGLTKLLARGEAAVIRESELRFTRSELLELCEQLGVVVDEKTVDVMLAQAQGWAIGLQFLLRSVSAWSERALVGDTLPSSMHHGVLADYFDREVLSKVAPALQSFLIRASVLPRLDARVCDAVFDTSESLALLRQAEARGMFLHKSGFDSFELHPLFRDFLCRRLAQDRDEWRGVHGRAARYFETNGDAAEAASHYIEADDYDGAASLISTSIDAWLGTSKCDSLINLVDRLPAQVSKRHPDLVMATGRAMALQGRFAEALSRCQEAYSLFCSSQDYLRASRALRAKGDILLWAEAKQSQAEAIHRRAMCHLSNDARLAKADLLRSLALDHMSGGDTVAALDLYRSAKQIYESEGNERGQLATLVSPGAYIHMIRGEFVEGLEVLQRAEELAVCLGSQARLVECYNIRASMLIFLGHHLEGLKWAERALNIARELRSANQCAWAKALVATAIQLMGTEPVSATAQRFHESATLAESCGSKRVMAIALLGLSDLYRNEGDLGLSTNYARRAIDLVEGASDQWLLAFGLRHLGASLASSEPAEALRILSSALNVFVRCEDMYNLAYVHFWLALACKKLMKAEDQRRHLEQCLDLAAINEYSRIFVDKSEAPTSLLANALCLGIQPDFVRRMLVRLGERGVEGLLPVLFGLDESARISAIRVLGQIGGVRAMSSLQALVKDKDELIRSEASAAIRALRSSPAPPLRIHLFGSVRVQIGEAIVDTSAWKRRKAKSLLAYLALNRGKAVHRDEIVEKLWPEMDSQAALNNLRVTIHDLRRNLDPSAQKVGQWRHVLYKDDRYSLYLGESGQVDVEAFRSGVKHAALERDVGKAIDKFENALKLYSGELLGDMPYEEWCSVEREELQDLYLDGLVKLAALYEAKGDYSSALVRFKRVLEMDDSREDVHRKLIHLYATMGNRVGAIRQYRYCARILKEELGVSPSRATRSVYNNVVSAS